MIQFLDSEFGYFVSKRNPYFLKVLEKMSESVFYNPNLFELFFFIISFEWNEFCFLINNLKRELK